MSLFLGSIYSTMELDTGKLSGQVSGAKKTLTGLTGTLGDMGSQGDRSFGKMVKASALGNIAAIGFSKGVGMLRDSVGTATKRVDTMNNATRTFNNMGFNDAQITRAMDNINKSILGMPTSLDSAVRSVTMMTAATGDLDKSQQIFAALNNGILGFGGTTEQVNTAVLQLSQAFAGGRVYAQDWYSMMNAGLGPALNAIAKQMGITTTELKEGLGDGSIEVQKFQDQLIKLNTEGGGGLVSLEKIALDSTKGINTGVANMQTAIARGMAGIIEAVGSARISGAIAGIGKGFESAMNVAASAITVAMPTIIAVFEGLGAAIQGTVGFIQGWIDAFKQGNPLVQAGTVFLGALAAGFLVVQGAILVYNVAMGIAAAVTGAFGAVMAVVTSPIFLVVAAIAAVVAIGFVLVKNWDKISAFASKVWGGITDAISTAWGKITGFFQTTWEAISGFFSKYGLIILAVVAPFIGIPLLIITHWNQITAFFAMMWQTLITGITTAVGAIIQWFQQLPYNFGLAVGTMVRFMIDLVTVHIPNFVAGVVSWFSQLPGMIASWFSQMWTNAVNFTGKLITDVLAFLQALPGQVAGFLQSAWSAVSTWFTNMWHTGVNLVSNMITSVVSFFMGLPGKAYNAAVSIVQKITGIITDVKDAMVKGAGEAIENTVNFFKELPGKIMDAISGLAGSIGDKFKSIASSAWEGFKKGLGIHSPSYIENAFSAIQNKGASTVSDMRSNMSRLNSLANSARRFDPSAGMSGSDFNGGNVPANGQVYQIDNLNLPNVQNSNDFARELKLATVGRK